MNPFHISSLLQPILAAPCTSFVRHRNYGYASSQELAPGTPQHGFHCLKEIWGGFND